MLKAMVFKELRETVGIAALALAAYAIVVLSQTGISLLPWLTPSYPDDRIGPVPFVSDGFLYGFAWVSVPFAVVLGFVQTAVESARGTWLFLLHRPASRRRILTVKLLTGGGLYLACAALPILIYMGWAASPGRHASPFKASMTLGAWQVWLSVGGLYLGAFLAGIRPGRWFGSRLFPVLAAALLVVAIQVLPWWWTVGLGATLALGAWLVVDIFFVARTRDFS